MPYDSVAQASFSWASDVLIFTDALSKNSRFYDYSLQPVQQSFDLPPQSVYSIVKALNGALLLAVGDDVTHFTSFEYFRVEGSVIIYKGTFPYIDSDYANHEKTLLLPKKNLLHIEYDSLDPSDVETTEFDLDKSPLKSLGYFFDPVSKECSDYDSAIFKEINGVNFMFVLVNDSPPRIEKIEVRDSKLTRREVLALQNFRFTDLTMKISSSEQELVLTGRAQNTSFYFEVRSINQLSAVLDSGFYGEADEVYGADFIDNKLFTVSSTNKTAEFLVSASTQNEVPFTKSY